MSDDIFPTRSFSKLCDISVELRNDRDAWKTLAEKSESDLLDCRKQLAHTEEGIIDTMLESDHLKAENERMRELVALVNRDGGQASVEQAFEAWFSIKAENERLRRALSNVCLQSDDENVVQLAEEALAASEAKAKE